MLDRESLLLLNQGRGMWYLMAKGRRSQYLLVVVFILTGFTFYFFTVHEESFQKSMRLMRRNGKMSAKGFSVYTPGCRIPEMHPFDISIRPYLGKPLNVQCSQKLSLIESNQTSIWVVAEALGQYNVTDFSELECCYTSFWRQEVNPVKLSSYVDNFIQMDNSCFSFNQSTHIYSEFIQVTCKVNNVSIYRDFHAFIVPKPKNLSSTDELKQNELSVLLIGADSLSRLNFLRQMPKTKGLMDLLGAIEFIGYNKVQDNTFPNLVSLLSGYSVEEIKDLCWANASLFFDDCPWIWKNYSSKNFYTAFGEDACWMGIFNYIKNGFIYPPTDYYLRPYIHVNEHFIGHTKLMNANFCDGTRFAAEVLFNYAYKFSVNMTLSNKKFWGLFWQSSLTHDFLNVPQKTDDLYYDLFLNLDQNGILNKTAIIFLSDHGMRWGKIRTTYQGRMEEHLPFLYILIPDWFKERYSSAIQTLQQNTRLLTTPFDVHETMRDFLNLENLNSENLELRRQKMGSSRGVSLFLPISVYRTCRTAGIGPTWCTCQRNKEVSKEDKHVQNAVKLSVAYLNQMLAEHKECAQLQLKEIVSAYVEFEEENISNSTSDLFSDYVVTIITTPGLAEFESVVRLRSGTNEMTVLEDISRLNVYGSQSKCISHYKLKLYCYCI